MTGPTTRRLSTALFAAILTAALPAISQAQARRVSHTATLLTSGDLLLTGGVDQTEAYLATADLLRISRGPNVVAVGPMNVARASHTATLLPNSCVLIAGGTNGGALESAELYDPVARTFTDLGGAVMVTPRFNHTATLLNTGVVLICGGQDTAGNALNSCETYTPGAACAGGAFAAAPNMLQARFSHTALLLKDGKVWFAGGFNPLIVATGGYLSTTERYNPDNNSFQSASPMIEGRSQHTATLMGDGKALVVGGFNARDVIANKGFLGSAEIFDPVSNSVAPAASMTARRRGHSAVLSGNGEIDVYGGLGNITTTYVDVRAPLVNGSTVTIGALTGPRTANLTGAGLMELPLDFVLNKPTNGMFEDAEIWMSSPVVKTDWGEINFTPASESVPGTGIRINLAGLGAGTDPVTGVSGHVKYPAVGMSNLQGGVIFYQREVSNIVPAAITAGTLVFAPTPVNCANINAPITAAGSDLTVTITIAMDNSFIGTNFTSGDLTIVSGAFDESQIVGYRAVLTNGTAVIPAGTPVVADALGNGQATFDVNFTNLAGVMSYIGAAPPGCVNVTSPLTIPVASALVPATLTMAMNYTMSGVDLSGELFKVDTSTIVIRRKIFADHEVYNPKTNSWTLEREAGLVTGFQRYGHSATLLNNNDTVIIGGRACQGATCATQTATASTGFQLLYSERNFTNPGGLAVGTRALHTSTLLPGGDILVAGGTNGPDILRSAEIYHPATETFSPTAEPMRRIRDLHTATLLPNGRVLIAGGFTNEFSTGSTNSSEIYYPDTQVFLETTPMISSRSNHSAIMLPDGRVFVAGGFGTNSALQNDVTSDTSEIYISTEHRWIPASNMPANCERALHGTVQLKDGRIMLIGGINSQGVVKTVAYYTPATDAWACSAPADPDSLPVALHSHSATLLFDGRVLVAGGNDGLGEANKSYIFEGGTWIETEPLAAPMFEPRFSHTATLLPNGNVMISGGSQRFGDVPDSIEVFHVNGSSWVTGGVTFFDGPRAFHTMTLGLNNKMYGIGGSDGVIGGQGVALYRTVETGYFTATPDNFTKNAPPSIRQSTITATTPLGPATTFLPGGSMIVDGLRFRGGTEASGGGAASANSAFSFPHLILQQVDGSGGGASQSNGGFVVDLTTQIFLNPANFATLDTKLTVALPANDRELPFGWYSVRTGANDVFSDGQLVQVGPNKPATQPANVAGVALGVSSMNWTWNQIIEVPPINGYNIYNSTSGVFLGTAPVSATPSFIQTGLGAGATASILVAAYSLMGDGPLTNSPTSYTLSTTPVNVTIASVTFSDLLLYWGQNGNTDATVYEITQSNDNFVLDFSTPVPKAFNLTDNFTTIGNLSANTDYFFRVRAFNPVGLPSPYSVTVTTRTRAPVSQPSVSARTTTSLTWGWSNPPGTINFIVYNATSGVVLANPATPFFTQVGIGTNTANAITVRAVTAAGQGPLSPSATAYTNAAVPAAVTVPEITVATGSFRITWDPNENPLPTLYRLHTTQYQSDGTVFTSGNQLTSGIPFQLNAGTFQPSSKVDFNIVAVNGDSIDSAVVAGTTWTLANPPTLLSVLGTSPTTISVGWNTNNNTSSATYEVTFSTNETDAGAWQTALPFSANFKGTTHTIPGLVTSSTYAIRVQSSNPFGQRSSLFSNVITTEAFNGGAPVGSVRGTLLFASDSTLFGNLGGGREVLVRAAAQTFPTDVLVTVSSHTPGAMCPGGVNIGFSITNIPALQPTGSLYLTFGFTPAELGAIPLNRALLLRFDPGSGQCVPLETTVDAASGRMTARINHFSLFQVGQVPQATSPDSARIFPNPYYIGRDGFLTIDNVPPDSRVRIFTLRGERVLDVKANGAGLLTWSGNNGFGRTVASGVYFVMIEAEGKKKILKLAVIR